MADTPVTYTDPREFDLGGVRYQCATCDDDGTIRVVSDAGRVRVEFIHCGQGARVRGREWERRHGYWHIVHRGGHVAYTLPATPEERAVSDSIVAAEAYQRMLRAEREQRAKVAADYAEWQTRDLVRHTGGRLRR